MKNASFPLRNGKARMFQTGTEAMMPFPGIVVPMIDFQAFSREKCSAAIAAKSGEPFYGEGMGGCRISKNELLIRGQGLFFITRDLC